MIDHVDQLAYVKAIRQLSGQPPRIFIKIDVNYGRAGVKTDSPEYPALIDALLAAEQEGWLVLHGVYTHAGQSYGTRREGHAMRILSDEFLHAHTAAKKIREKSPDHAPLVLSAGATPTATTIQSPVFMDESDVPPEYPGGMSRPLEEVLLDKWAVWQKEGYLLEVHAGV